MQVFKSSKHPISTTLCWVLVLALVVILFIEKQDANEPPIVIFHIIIISIAGMLAWILLDTKYKIDAEKLYYYSGPIRGKIDIQSIRKIEHLKTWYTYSLLKPALGMKGLVIHYNQFDDIYISPKDKEKFVAELLKINPNIIVF